jgi:hypothetical protein
MEGIVREGGGRQKHGKGNAGRIAAEDAESAERKTKVFNLCALCALCGLLFGTAGRIGDPFALVN